MKLFLFLLSFSLGVSAFAYAYKKESHHKGLIILATILGVLAFLPALLLAVSPVLVDAQIHQLSSQLSFFPNSSIEPAAGATSPTPTAHSGNLPPLEHPFLFSSNQNTSRELYLHSTSAEKMRLTTNTISDDYPSWSPDRLLIAFTTHRDGNNEIYVMQSNGDEPINISNHPDADFWPSWSPDGKYIAFSHILLHK